MSATTLNKRWDDGAKDQFLSVFDTHWNLFSRIGVKPQERHCPSCDSVVYTRRHRLCGVCGQVLPADCLFTTSEAENVDSLLKTERRRHKAWLRRIEDGQR